MDKINLPGAAFMRTLAGMISAVLPKNIGFALIIFEFQKPGIGNYISNAERNTMLQGLRETIKRLENNEDFPTHEEG